MEESEPSKKTDSSAPPNNESHSNPSLNGSLLALKSTKSIIAEVSKQPLSMSLSAQNDPKKDLNSDRSEPKNLLSSKLLANSPEITAKSGKSSKPSTTKKRKTTKDSSNGAIKRRRIPESTRSAMLAAGEEGLVEYMLRWITSPDNDWNASDNWRCLNTIETIQRGHAEALSEQDLRKFKNIKVKGSSISAKLSDEQTAVLESFYSGNPFPTSELKIRLANQVNISGTRITSWFHRRRARARKDGERISKAQLSLRQADANIQRLNDRPPSQHIAGFSRLPPPPSQSQFHRTYPNNSSHPSHFSPSQSSSRPYHPSSASIPPQQQRHEHQQLHSYHHRSHPQSNHPFSGPQSHHGPPPRQSPYSRPPPPSNSAYQPPHLSHLSRQSQPSYRESMHPSQTQQSNHRKLVSEREREHMQNSQNFSELPTAVVDLQKLLEVLLALRDAVRLDTSVWKKIARQWGKLDDERYRLETEGRKMWLKLEIERRRRQVETNSVLEGPDGFGLSSSDIPYACSQIRQEYEQLKREREAMNETRIRMETDLSAFARVHPPKPSPQQNGQILISNGKSASNAIELD